MPELPEVETMRRGLLPIVGRRIVEIRRAPCRCRPLTITPSLAAVRKRCLKGRVVAISRIGKRVVVELDNDQRLLFEPRMTGLVLLADPPDREHLRLRVTLAAGKSDHNALSELLYWDRRGLGLVRVFNSAELARALGSEVLGPDALQVDAALLEQRLGDSRQAVKVALLNQRRVAGIGNLYASEILHLAGVDPRQACHRVSPQQWQAIQRAMIDVLETAIRYEGSTLSDGTYRNALNQAGGFQNHHQVYDREDEPCRRCQQGRVVRIVQAQRATFFCPHCQSRRAWRG